MNRRWHLFGLLVAGTTLPFVLFGIYAWQGYDEALELARDRAVRSAALLAEHADRVFQAHALAIELVEVFSEGLSNHDIAGSPRLQTFLAAQAQRTGMTGSLMITDAAGTILASSKNNHLAGRDLSQRQSFRGAVAADGGLHLGARALGLNAQTPLFSLSRKRPGGGVISAAIYVSYFENVFATLSGDASRERVVVLYRADGRNLVRYPDIGRNVDLPPGSPGLMQAIAQGPSGAYRTVSLVDHKDRQYAYHKVGNHPAYIAVGIDIDAALTPWYRASLGNALMALAASAMLAYFALTALRRDTATEAYTATLAAAVAERTAAAEGAIRAREAALQDAERAAEAKSQFLAAASHDLRQPIQGVRLFLDLLAERLQDPANQRAAAMATKALEGAEGLLTALLDVSTLDAGTVIPNPRELPLAEVVSDLVAELRPQAEAAGLSLRRVACSCRVTTDPVLLQRILRNLLCNAIRYTDKGGILLGCRRRGHMVRIEVWDTGTGIPSDKIGAVFEDFVQLGNPERDRSKGLGLGLSVVRRMADLLGYTVEVRSRPGRGSVFAVGIPFGTTAAEVVESSI